MILAELRIRRLLLGPQRSGMLVVGKIELLDASFVT